MNIKALVTMLVLGSSSAALAHPVGASSAGSAPVIRDHRMPTPAPGYQPDYVRPSYRPGFVPVWTTLGTESRIVDGEMGFRVSPWLGKFSTLKLQSFGGKSLIYRVKVQFSNGRSQVVELNQYLNAANPTITIDLAGDWSRSISKVTVVGRNARQSSYRVLAI